jgi:hypothetical protein
MSQHALTNVLGLLFFVASFLWQRRGAWRAGGPRVGGFHKAAIISLLFFAVGSAIGLAIEAVFPGLRS